jgi:anti-sigma factor RsiW
MHPETEIVAWVRGELAPAERARVAGHLEACADCRRVVEETREVLAGLVAGGPAPPPLDWGRWQAELRGRVESGGRRRRPWWTRPVPMVLAAGLAAASVLLAVHGLDRGSSDLAAVEETALGARLPLLQDYPVVERLDLLENLDVIRNLDRLAAKES